MPDEFQLWVLSFEVLNLFATVRVNDVTVYAKDTGPQTSFGAKINPLLAVGENSVTVSLALSALAAPHSEPSQPPVPQDSLPPPMFAMKVQRGFQGTDPGEEGILVRYEWKPGQPPLVTGRLSTVVEQTFEVPELPWELPAWTRVSPLTVDRNALELFVQRYADTMRNRDLDRAVESNRLRLLELARSLDLDGASMVQGFRRYLEGLMAAADWSVLVSGELRFALEGFSRLVRITAQNGSAPIHAVSNGKSLPFDITVSFVNSNWYIVR
jgi:hypothetical protein